MNRVRRLKRVFGIGIESRARCCGKRRIHRRHRGAAGHCEELAHLRRTTPEQYQCALPLAARASPMQSSLL
jgi:hypothetical protein